VTATLKPGFQKTASETYRPDIDGLRAVAVLSVIAYHFSSSILPGGYLGVDVFFVLSGYLITSILWREAIQNRLSIVRFYDRRVRRIMPALLFLLVATSFFATALLLPADLIGYGKSLLATLVFLANIYFWRDTDYFSRTAEQKPLLHLWSLGVEEQFYILFPAIIALLARFGRRSALAGVTAVTLASFALNVMALRIGGESPAFFLLPTRAWELGAGAMLAVIPARSRGPGIRSDEWMVETISIGGALLLVLGLCHPVRLFGVLPVALPVVFGTTALIYAASSRPPLINQALSWPPVVFVGLISYSLYLWHWPVIVFARYYLVRDLSAVEMCTALVLMLVMAVLSWRYVERPFRQRTMPIRKAALIVVGTSLALTAIASVTVVTSGLPQRLDPKAAGLNNAVGTNYRCPVNHYLAFGGARACQLNLPNRSVNEATVILVGNSHAQMYAPAWEKILVDRNLAGLLVPMNGCLPTVSANLNAACIAAAERQLSEITKLKSAKVVILGLNWAHGPNRIVSASGAILDNRNHAAVVDAINDLVGRLTQLGLKVVLIGPIQPPDWDVASELSRQMAFGRKTDRLTFAPAPLFRNSFGSVISGFEQRRDITFIRPDRIQCADDQCRFVIDGRSLFADDSGHIAMRELFRFDRIFALGLNSALALDK
jgi:peptidoglycan/LPS O-acetylase OafA/YrhL